MRDRRHGGVSPRRSDASEIGQMSGLYASARPDGWCIPPACPLPWRPRYHAALDLLRAVADVGYAAKFAMASRPLRVAAPHGLGLAQVGQHLTSLFAARQGVKRDVDRLKRNSQTGRLIHNILYPFAPARNLLKRSAKPQQTSDISEERPIRRRSWLGAGLAAAGRSIRPSSFRQIARGITRLLGLNTDRARRSLTMVAATVAYSISEASEQAPKPF